MRRGATLQSAPGPARSSPYLNAQDGRQLNDGDPPPRRHSSRSLAAPVLKSVEHPPQSTLVFRLSQLPTPLFDQPLTLPALQKRADALAESRHGGASSNREFVTYPLTARHNPSQALRPVTRAATARAHPLGSLASEPHPAFASLAGEGHVDQIILGN